MKRKELGVKTRLISHLDLKPLEDQYQGLNVEIRYFPLATETFGCHFSCTNERVTIIGFLQERNGVIIESRELADTFAKWFDYTWEMLKKNN